jgi:hypothetical protein
VITEKVQQRQPRLTFACELDCIRLTELFSDASIFEDLKALEANVLLMLSDFSPERADVVKKLNAARIPVTAIPLLPYEEGYYFTIDNAPRAVERYEEWKKWTAEHGLVWEGVGLDIEPEARFYEQIMENPWGLLPMLLRRLRDTERLRRAKAAYSALINRIHTDAYSVENYQFPIIADERRAKSALLQRLLGLVDVRTDREVWMLYNSFLPALGPGLLWSYGPEAQALAVGTTGGGPDVPGHPQFSPLSWEEFARDLRLARHFSDDLFVHSLEGCVWQGYLTRLRSFDWEQPAALPKTAPLAEGLRAALRGMLWASAHPWSMLGGVAVATVWLLSRWRRT